MGGYFALQHLHQGYLQAMPVQSTDLTDPGLEEGLMQQHDGSTLTYRC
jgi:hypothetical protein